MTYLLRHNPKVINLLMDNEGWVGIDELVTQ
ncbi:RNA 2'-phosphotransferase [Vulcanisaeta sp. JCM 16159]